MGRVPFGRITPYLLFLLAFPLGMALVQIVSLDGPTICLFRQMTHLDCPGCGMTRAFRELGRLQVAEAVRYNPMSVPFFLGVLVYWGYCAAMVVTRGRVTLPDWWHHWRSRILWGFFLLYLAAGLVRIGYQVVHPPPPPRPWTLPGWHAEATSLRME